MNKSVAFLTIAALLTAPSLASANPNVNAEWVRLDPAPGQLDLRTAPNTVSAVESEQLRQLSVVQIQQQLDEQIARQISQHLTPQ